MGRCPSTSSPRVYQENPLDYLPHLKLDEMVPFHGRLLHTFQLTSKSPSKDVAWVPSLKKKKKAANQTSVQTII